MKSVFVKHYSLPVEYDKTEIFRYLGAKNPDEEIIRLTDECLRECDNIFAMSVCAYESQIEKENGKLVFDSFSAESSDLEKNLSGCERVIIFAATIGIGIDRLITKYSLLSPAKALVFQAVGAERIEALCDKFCKDMSLEYEKEGCFLRPRFSPGYGNLSLSVQKDIFSLLGCEKRTGLTLSDNLLMSPSKSVTAFSGIYRK